MFSESLAKHFGFPIRDFYSKTKIINTLQFLRGTQFWNYEKMEDYRLVKFLDLIQFAYTNVPYYENIFNKIKLKPSDIKSFNDLSKIPILTKETVIKENKNLIARNFDLRYVKMGKTGGTTGVPVIIYKDVYNRTFTWASYYRWFEWMGINYYNKKATLWGSPYVLNQPVIFKTGRKLVDILLNQLSIDSFRMNEEETLNILHRIITFEPAIIKGYLSSMVNLAQIIKRNPVEFPKLKAISSTTETIYPHIRKFLEEVFKVPYYDQYGCGELSAISYECPAHLGLHINQEHIICEILDENDCPIVNSPGRIIGTDLDNRVMPFIRYENGDVAVLSEKKCTCGVNQPLFHSLSGRISETITLKNGCKVHGVFFSDIFFELNILADKIQRFQVYQNYPGNIELRLESQSLIDSKLKSALENTLLRFFNSVKIIELKKIENEKNGKFRYIINEIVN